MKKLLIIALLLLLPVMAMAADFGLEWQANTEPDLAGYRVYWKPDTPGPPYASVQDVGKVTEHKLTLADGKTYYIAVTAYDTSGLESDYSNEVNTDTPAQPSGLKFKPVARITIEIPQ